MRAEDPSPLPLSPAGARGKLPAPSPLLGRGLGVRGREQRLTPNRASRGGLRAMIRFGKTAGNLRIRDREPLWLSRAGRDACSACQRRLGGAVARALSPVVARYPDRTTSSAVGLPKTVPTKGPMHSGERMTPQRAITRGRAQNLHDFPGNRPQVANSPIGALWGCQPENA
jgi:hypothetical protein